MTRTPSSLAISVALVVYLMALCSGMASAQQRSDLNLVIAIDCSWSVNKAEYALQIGGIATAFSNPEVIAAIQRGQHQNIAVTVVQWSTAGSQIIAIPWTQITTLQDSLSFASRAATLERLTLEGGTSITAALNFSQKLLANAPFRADRHVIDVVADGESNNGGRVEPMRDYVVGQGTTINGLAVINEYYWLHHYLRNRVIGGPGAFVELADDYADFSRAFLKKLLREIKGELLTQADPTPLSNATELR